MSSAKDRHLQKKKKRTGKERAVIQASNLSFSYTASPPYLLRDIDLEIADGEYISVVGDNGCGKSTFIRLILKFIKPTKGKIATRARRIGYLPQRKENADMDFPITVYEMLNAYRKVLKIAGDRVVDESLDKVGMRDFRSARMGDLSGGQGQKILIARAMMGTPELLVLDEPSTGVDAGSQLEIYALLKAINRDRGVTIVSVEHNLAAAIANSTLIYHLMGGRGHLCSPAQYAREFLSAQPSCQGGDRKGDENEPA
jgi:zinc transport system ATP-binding protein